MTKEKILKAVISTPRTADQICNISKVSKTYTYKILSELKQEGKIITIPSSPVSYIKIPETTRSNLIKSLLEEAAPLFPTAVGKLEMALLEQILTGDFDKEQVERLSQFFNQLIGSLLYLLDIFQNPKYVELPSADIYKRYQTLKLKEHS